MSENKEVKKAKRPLPKSRVMLNALVDSIYEEAYEAERKGEPIGWSTSIFPQEICATFGVPVLFPENNAAGVAARHNSPRFIATAEGKLGYSNDICSYARLSIGMAHEIAHDPDYVPVEVQRMPRPTFLLCATNSCFELLKWYECLSRELDIPIFMQDCLFNCYEDEPYEHRNKFGKSQILHNIKRMEEFFGKKFDWDKFEEIQKISGTNSRLFDECVLMNDKNPSPLNGFDLFNYMAMVVVCRSKPYSEITLRRFADELEEKNRIGKYAFGDAENEQHRITWEGIAVWPYLGGTFKELKNEKTVMTGSAYPGMWDFEYIPGDMMSMAETYSKVYLNCCGPQRYEDFYKVVSNSKSDGILLHLNRSCKIMAFLNQEGAEYVNAKMGVPFVSFDGDQTDPRVFAQAQFDTRVQALCEMMDEE